MNSMLNLACPPVRIHWSMKTPMSLPVTVKMLFLKLSVLMTMFVQAAGFFKDCEAVVAKESCLFKTYASNG